MKTLSFLSRNLVGLPVAVLMFSVAAQARPICSTAAIGAIPQTADGVYINFVTGGISTFQPVTSWDFNPYSSANSLAFYFPTNAGALASIAGLASVLSEGAVIDANAHYESGHALNTASSMANWQAGVTGGYLGVQFTEGGDTFYGWVKMTTTGTLGFPASISKYCYEAAPGMPIAAGYGDLIFHNGFEPAAP